MATANVTPIKPDIATPKGRKARKRLTPPANALCGADAAETAYQCAALVQFLTQTSTDREMVSEPGELGRYFVHRLLGDALKHAESQAHRAQSEIWALQKANEASD
jgi:hypothetical protein